MRLRGLTAATALLAGLWAAPALGAIARVAGQSASATASATSVSAAFTSNPTAGNLIIAYLSITPATTSTTFTAPVWLTQVARNNASASTSIIYYAKNITGGSGQKTLAFSGLPTGSKLTLQIVEYSGLDTSSPLDTSLATSSGTVTNAAAASSGSISPSFDSELIVVGMTEDSNDGFTSPTPTTFTTAATEAKATGNSATADLWDEVVSDGTSGGVALTALLGGHGTQNYSAVIASFHAPSFFWVGGGGDSKFSNSANWAATSGGSGGVGVPGAGNNVTFDGSGLNDCTIDQVVSVGSITIQGGYKRTITPSSASNTITTSAGFSIAAGLLNLAGGTLTVGGALTVGGGTINLAGGTLTTSGATTVSSGTLNVAGGTVAARGGVTVSGGTLDVAAGSFTADTAGTVTIGGGTLDADGGTVTLSVATTVSGGSLKATEVSGAGSVSLGSTLTVSGGTVDANGGTITVTGAATMSSGNIEATAGSGAGSITFSSTVTMSGGTYDPNGGTGTFDGATTISGATFYVGDTTQTLAAGLTMSSGTLDMTSDGGSLQVSALSISGGTFRATGTSSGSYPLVTSSSGNYAFTISGGTLNLNGLRVQNANTNGMNVSTTLPTAVTVSAFKNVLFSSNQGGGGSTHLKFAFSTNLTASATIVTSGCEFDTTAAANVTTTAQNQGSNTNGVYFVFDLATGGGLGGEGEALDSDGDAGPDGVIDNYRSNATVVSWTTSAQSDIAGAAVGFPTAAFDWNTFVFYSVYAAFSGAAANTDRIYVRTADGSADYSYDIDTSTYGNIIGTSLWDTVSETGTFDVNGNGTLGESNVHVLYVATTGGHIFKLIDSGSSLALPGAGSTWHTPFPSNAPSGSLSITAISTAITTDRTNLYFGGASSGNNLFGVQIASGGSTCNGTNNGLTTQEKCAMRYNLGGTPTAITASLATSTFGGDQYVYVASTNTIYRYDVSTASLSSSFATSGAVTGRLVLLSGTLWSADSASKVNRLNADPTSGSGTFVNLTGFPFTGSGTLSAPTVDYTTSSAYVGNSAGTLYKISSAGATTWSLSSGLGSISSAPFYVSSTGYVIAGDTSGKVVYVLDSGSSATLKYTLNLSGAVSAISYNPQVSKVMVSTASGGLYYLPTSMP